MVDTEEPIFEDALFRQKRKHGEWREIEAPVMEAPVADTHAHLHMLADPALALARAGAHRVEFVETIMDPAEDGFVVFDKLPGWLMEAVGDLRRITGDCNPGVHEVLVTVPRVRIAAGVHPHNAKDYTAGMEAALREHLADRRVSAVGEIGLDYHYDLSPRDVQREVFRAQIRLAKEADLPVVLHMREAHDDGFAILQEEGFPQAGTLLHCYNLDAAELQRWVDAGCYVAFGGPLTFKKTDEVREAAKIVPEDRLLTETDSPYMTPEPLRGINCEPAYTILTADLMAQVRGADTPEARAAFLARIYENALELLDREATPWQREHE